MRGGGLDNMPDTQENEENEENQPIEENVEEEEKTTASVFNLEEELQKEKRYLRKGFPRFITKNGYDVDTKRKYNIYMKKYKEA
jgi:hypothetical protein